MYPSKTKGISGISFNSDGRPKITSNKTTPVPGGNFVPLKNDDLNRQLTEMELIEGLKELNRLVLHEALTQKDLPLPIKLASAGGAYLVMHLHTRTTTSDVDVYHPDKTLEDWLGKLSRQVSTNLKWENTPSWFNSCIHSIYNENQAYKDEGVYEATLKNEKAVVLFEGEGIEIRALPVEWQLNTKLLRLCVKYKRYNDYKFDGKTQKDLKDAAVFVQQLLAHGKVKTLKASELKQAYNGTLKKMPECSEIDVILADLNEVLGGKVIV